jgi:hypothetical protein
MRLARTLAAILLVCAAVAAEAPPELKERPNDIVVMKDGREIDGTLVEQRTDGLIRFKPRISNEEIIIAAGTYERVLFRRPIAQVVAEVAKHHTAAGDQRRVLEALRWGAQREATDAVLAAAAGWLKRQPGDREVLAIAIPLWRGKNDWAAIEAAARAGVAADRNWSEGEDLLAEALGQLGRSADLETFAREWLGRNPTALRANLICGAAFERAGDMRLARECFRKAWDLHKNPLGGLGLARTSLHTGHYADALRAAQTLAATPELAAEARAYGGAAAAALGDLAAAKPLLDGFKPETLPGPAAQAGAYALGLIAYREGRAADAARLWQGVPTPAAQLAVAIAQRREFTGVERLPAEQRAAAVLLNASVRLENRQPAKALEVIDQHLDGRHAFLHRVAQIMVASGAPDSVRPLAVIRSPEAQRWMIYGHILGGRLDEAEQLARALPASDGYAMACRVFIAAARGDPEGARMLYEGSGGLPGAPAEYAKRLSELYSTADDQQVVEAFDWPEGQALASGWDISAPGTGIELRAGSGRLTLEGTQSDKADDPVTRAYTLVPGARFRLARLALDTSTLGTATAGLELLDAARKNGVAIAVIGGRDKLHWRQLAAGRWGEWSELPYAVDGALAVVSLDVSGGRIHAADPADPLRRTRLSDVLARSQGDWLLSVFGTAPAGATWKAGFDDLRWRLKPAP